jgi:hypothetical protein
MEDVRVSDVIDVIDVERSTNCANPCIHDHRCAAGDLRCPSVSFVSMNPRIRGSIVHLAFQVAVLWTVGFALMLFFLEEVSKAH